MTKRTKTKTRTSTATIVATALLAGAGLAAAAGMATKALGPTDLRMRMTPGQPGLTEAVRGSENVHLLSFDLQPRGGAATVDEIVFSAFGDLDDSFSAIARDVDVDERFLDCTLKDSSGAVVAGPDTVSGGYLTFSDPFTVASGSVSTYRVYCDLSNTETTDGTADRIAIAIAGESGVTADIGGTTLSGASLTIGGTGADTLNATGGISTRVQDDGRLTLRPSADMTASAIVLGGSTSVDVGRWEFQAAGEDFLIETLSFDDMLDDSAVATAHLRCTNEDGSGYTDTEAVSAGHVTFENAECYARADDTASVTLSVDTNLVGSGADSGDRFRYALNATDAGSFTAIGVMSGNDYDETDVSATVSGREMILRQSVPEFSLSSASPTGPGTPGLDEVLRFNVAAASTEDITVDQLVFRVVTTDVAGTGWNDCGDGTSKTFGENALWNLYDLDDTSTPLSDDGDWSLLKADGSACGQAAEPVAYAVVNLAASASTGSLDLSAGETATLSLKVDTTGADAATGDTVRFELLSESDARAIRRQAVVWDDGTEASNISGVYLQVLPLIGGSISY